MPSTTVNSDQLTIPNNVGTNIFVKSLEILLVPKSISSLPAIIAIFANIAIETEI
jgi:hypothetical protein